ncbi:MAG: VOC family protein [Protaetiibacter sp.]
MPDAQFESLLETYRTITGGRQPDQVSLLVPELADAVRRWSAVFGDDEWLVYSYNPDTLPESSFRGAPGRFSIRLALHGRGPQLELIELLEGPSLYHEWVEERGWGMHHIGYWIPSITDVVERFRALGREPDMTGARYGLNGDGGYAYYDFMDELGVVAEFIEVPSVRRPSEAL